MSYQDRKLTEALSGASRGGKTARALCPFCVDEGYSGRYKNLALTYQTGRWGCYRCKRWGYLKGSEYLIQGEEEGAPTTSGPPAGWQEIGARPTLATVSAWAYARSRGISEDAITETRMGVALQKPEEGEQDFRHRLVVPILGQDGETWLGHVGRSLLKDPPLPYLYSRGLSRGKILYNAKALQENTERPLLVVEGTLDAAFLWPDAVAVLGTWSDPQVELLRATKRPIAVVLDGDAWRKGEALALILQLYGVRAGYVRLPAGKDPDRGKTIRKRFATAHTSG
jgi:hypothetical protein